MKEENTKKTKIFILMLIAFFTISGFTGKTYVLEKNTENIVSEDMTIDEYIYPNHYVNPNYAINIISRLGQKSATSKFLSVTQWYQDSGTYVQNYMLPCNRTIFDSGCTLTSFTMTSNFMKSTNYNPGQVNTVLGNNACPFNWSAAASTYGLTHTLIARDLNGLARSNVENWIYSQISNNHPVIVGLKLSSGSTHYVVAYGYADTGSEYIYYIKNSNVGSTTTLNQYYTNGASVIRLDIYY